MIGKRFLPQSLFGRALLILLVPTVLIQLVMAYVFFDRHLDNVVRQMARALAGESAFLVSRLESWRGGRLPEEIREFTSLMQLSVDMDVGGGLAPGGDDFPEFREQLHQLIDEPFSVRKRGDGSLEIRILLPGGTLTIATSVKRLEPRTAVIFLLWTLGATVVFLLVAVLFLRNQIRPIRKLAQAADNFGRGIDMPDFRPSGASEVRTAARAFITMRERIKRQLKTRTEMLAGISHDLRTPLTRMKLELEMSGGSKELKDDVQQMEHMISEYLDFARGDAGEDTQRVDLSALLEDILSDYRRQRANVVLEAAPRVQAEIRVTGFRRMLHNLIDNALRYGTHCRLRLKAHSGDFELIVDDDGPGIPPEKREEVFRPFHRLDPSRNVKTGGAGLGLTIARDIALSHGGSIGLETSPEGGLRVVVRLPKTKGGA